MPETQILYRIAKNLPPPLPYKNRRPMTWPFDQLKKGESLTVKGTLDEITKARMAAHNYAHRHKKDIGCIFTSQMNAAKTEITVWRVK